MTEKKKSAEMTEKKKPVESEDQEIFGDEAEDDVIQLLNDDGETLDFYHVATIEFKGEWFVFFQPAEEMDDIDEDEIVIFKLESDENGDDVFIPLEDEKLLDEVYEEYMRISGEDEEGCCCHGDDCDCCDDEDCGCDDEDCDCGCKNDK